MRSGNCFDIEEEPCSASFGFLGAHTIDFSKEYEERKFNTRRFRIYKYAIEELIGTEYFSHYMDVTNSTYLIVNNKVSDTDAFSLAAIEMFMDIHPELAGL
jgi:hypothetical protein